MRKLPKKWIDHLVKLPETGMGWQKCKIIDKNGIHLVPVANSEIFYDSNVDIDSIITIEVETK